MKSTAYTPDNVVPQAMARADRDLVALGIAVAAILLFVGTGGMVVPQVMRSWLAQGAAPDSSLVSALLLNIALVIFGWRRYAELTREIAERRKAEERARQLSDTDPLTGSLNRRSIGPATRALIGQTRSDGRAVAFIMVDLDNFKLINDIHGHQAGDALLKITADRIRALLPRGGVLARLGGDEFACVVPFDRHHPERIDQFAAQLIERVAQPAEHKSLALDVTISVGIADDIHDCGETAVDADGLIHRADIAMYHAKKQGKNRYFWFEQSMESALRFRGALEHGIRKGIPGGEFLPYYEQQIDLTSGELAGFEMLARWESPTLGLINPNLFIPVAENIGMIAELSEALIDQAMAHAVQWDPQLTLAVNISPLQLRDPWFSQKILKLLVKHNFPPQRLDIEITESCLHDDVGVVRSILASLRNQGIRISLDDFGTGYSSLAQLRTLPFDQIKIDRSLVCELNDPQCSDKLVRAIVSLGEGLDLPLVAEGIDDPRILVRLKDIGCLKGQGYLYGQPEGIDAVRSRLSAAGLLVGGRSAAEPVVLSDAHLPRKTA